MVEKELGGAVPQPKPEVPFDQTAIRHHQTAVSNEQTLVPHDQTAVRRDRFTSPQNRVENPIDQAAVLQDELSSIPLDQLELALVKSADLHVPTEVLEEIFLRLDTQDLLLRACCVCKSWRQVIQSPMFWRKKLAFSRPAAIPRSVLQNLELDWQFYAALSQRNSYNVNLIKNGCGELVEVLTIHQAIELENNSEDSDSSWPEYPYWTVLSSGGQGWTLELLGELDHDLAEQLSHSACFSTSFHSCSKEQLVHLSFPEHILDHFQPPITVSDYYTKSPEHAAVYDLHVCVVDGCGNVLGKSFSFRENMERTDGLRWRKISHTFQDYGVGARYVKFYHGGMAMDMEEGWHGAKMTGSSVMVAFPGKRKTTQNYRCSCKIRH